MSKMTPMTQTENLRPRRHLGIILNGTLLAEEQSAHDAK
jgi:hypothetical protein